MSRRMGSAGVYDVSVTDHNPTFLFIPCKYLSKVGASRLQRSAYVDYVRLNRSLQDVGFESIYDNDIEKECANFLESISNLIRRSTRERTRRNYNHAICPWMTHDLLEMLKLKDSYYKGKNDRSNTYYRESFKFYRNKSVTMKRKLKREYYTNSITRNGSNAKKVWQVVRDVTGIGQTKRILPDNISSKVAEDFNAYFTSTGANLASQFCLSISAPSFPKLIDIDFNLAAVTTNEIKYVVAKMPVNKATGDDRIPVKVIKDNINLLCIPICHIFNHAFTCRIYPSSLKTPKVVPVYKSGDSNNPENYRPISVLSCLNTLFEKIIVLQLKRSLVDNDIICPQQHGFVPARSTA